MDNKLSWVLSPCGTSLLTNTIQKLTNNAGENRGRIFKHANAKSDRDIPSDDLKMIHDIAKKAREALMTANCQEAAKLSAELNGLSKLYNNSFHGKRDFHFLLCTDTYLGELTGKLVKEWLEKNGKDLIVNVNRQRDLQTEDIDSFQLALSELVKEISNHIEGYKKNGYRIIFNLTGGFKSVQGFLQSIANFYADESIYIFESSKQLLRIPRLPIQMDALETVENNLSAFRLLALDVNVNDTTQIPETLLLKIEDEVRLSPWGEIVWEKSKKEIYRQRLLPAPIEQIRYTKAFENSVSGKAADRVYQINQRIDQLAKYFISNKSYNPSSLDFKKLQGNPMPPSTHEFDAWADQDAQRVFGHFEGKVFVLDNLAQGLH